jgi:hypothetical protein
LELLRDLSLLRVVLAELLEDFLALLSQVLDACAADVPRCSCGPQRPRIAL